MRRLSPPAPDDAVPVTFLAHPDYARHRTGPGHPERPERLRAIEQGIERAGLEGHLRRLEPEAVDLDLLTTVHTAGYVEQVRWLAGRGGGPLDADTVVCPASYDVALLAAGGAVAAAREARQAQAGRAFAAVRPPGHHARPAQGMGFCLFNNVACAAEAARGSGCARVLILDWDVHHGNGTQEIFYRRGDVLLCSLHQEPWYPGTGAAEETGDGDGAGWTVNIPLPAGTGDEGYRLVFEEIVLPLVGACAPDLVLVSAGYDAHHADPLGGMRLTAAGFAALTRLLLTAHPGPLAAVLEGGYALPHLGDAVAATLAVLAGAAPPATGEAAPGEETPYRDLRPRVREIRRIVRTHWAI